MGIANTVPDSRAPRRFATVTRPTNTIDRSDPMLVRPRDRRPDREDPGHDRDDHGHHVVEEERGRRHQPRQGTEVLLAHDVGPAAARVRPDRLAVRDDHDRHQRGDRDRDRHDVALRRGRGREQHDEDLAGGVGDRRQRVGGEDRQRQDLGEQRVLEPSGREGAAEDHTLDHTARSDGEPGSGHAAVSLRRRHPRWVRTAVGSVGRVGADLGRRQMERDARDHDAPARRAGCA